jgi:hypothetical protein
MQSELMGGGHICRRLGFAHPNERDLFKRSAAVYAGALDALIQQR